MEGDRDRSRSSRLHHRASVCELHWEVSKRAELNKCIESVLYVVTRVLPFLSFGSAQMEMTLTFINMIDKKTTRTCLDFYPKFGEIGAYYLVPKQLT